MKVKNPSITVHAEEKPNDWGERQVQMDFEFASNKDHGSCFFTLGKGEAEKYQKTYKSESHHYHGNYKFHPVLISTDALAHLNGNNENNIHVTIFKYSKEGNHMKICALELHYDQFLKLKANNLDHYEEENPFGEFRFTNINIKPRVKFLDYILGGCEVSIHTFVDFT